MKASRQAVVVLGMHRSGTSLMAALLCAAGADPPKHLQPGDKYNETGYWESARLFPLHDELLEALGLSWDSVVRFPASLFHSPIVTQYRARIIELLREEYADSELFCVKEPRIARLLPLWMPLLKSEGVQASYVIITRNPLEVAQSLKRRNGFHTSKSLLLWLHHTLEAEHDTRGHRRVFVTYDQLMSDWHDVLRKIGDCLDIVWPRPWPEIDVEFERIISEKFRRYRVAPEKIAARNDLAEWVADAYRAFLAAAEGEENAQLRVFDRLRREIATACKAFEPLLIVEQVHRREAEERQNELAGQTQALESSVAAAQARAEQIAGELGQREGELGAARADLEAARAEVEATRAAVEAAESSRAALQSDVAALTTRTAEQDAALGQARTKLSETETARADAQMRSEQIAAELGQREGELGAARAEVEAARAEVETARAEAAAAESARAALQSEATGLRNRVAESDAELVAARALAQRLQRVLQFREAEVKEMQTLLALHVKTVGGNVQAAPTLRESERVAILSAKTAQLNADLALSVEETALEDAVTKLRIAAVVEPDAIQATTADDRVP